MKRLLTLLRRLFTCERCGSRAGSREDCPACVELREEMRVW